MEVWPSRRQKKNIFVDTGLYTVRYELKNPEAESLKPYHEKQNLSYVYDRVLTKATFNSCAYVPLTEG